MPSARTAGKASGEGPKLSIVEARCDLLAAHGFPTPGRGTEGTEALYKFIDGESPLARRDCLYLSRWLQSVGPPNVDLLLAMQEADRSFVPTLDLVRRNQDPQALIDLLMTAHDKGLTFGVSVTEALPMSVAHVLRGVMASPQSGVTTFDYPCQTASREGQAPDVREVLTDCITDCPSLECVSGFLPVLFLLKRSVPAIELVALSYPPVELETELDRVLSQGNVERLSVKSDARTVHLWAADVVARANERLSPERSIHQVEVMTFARRANYEHLGAIVGRLFSAKHLRHLTLPDPSWVHVGFSEAYEPGHSAQYYQGGWRRLLQAPDALQSLQSLTFLHEDARGDSFNSVDQGVVDGMIGLLGAILQRNKQRALLEVEGAGRYFTSAITRDLFKSSQHEHLLLQAALDLPTGLPIEALASHLAEAFAGTSTGQALKVLNVGTAAGAKDGHDEAEKQYQNNVVRADRNYESKRQERLAARAAISQSEDGVTNPDANSV